MPNWLAVLLQLALWCAWWLLAVNWAKAWPVLARGAWAPVVLLMLMSAYVWSLVSPAPLPIDLGSLGQYEMPNFWWQLGNISAWVALALLCGWLQGKLGWAPAEINLEPPPPQPEAGHHGHH